MQTIWPQKQKISWPRQPTVVRSGTGTLRGLSVHILILILFWKVFETSMVMLGLMKDPRSDFYLQGSRHMNWIL